MANVVARALIVATVLVDRVASAPLVTGLPADHAPKVELPRGVPDLSVPLVTGPLVDHDQKVAPNVRAAIRHAQSGSPLAESIATR